MATLKSDRYMFMPGDHSKFTGGLQRIRARSSWELDFMERLDAHPFVSRWDYEPFTIPYLNPLWSDRVSEYLPDFWVEYIGRGGVETKAIVEIKPAKYLALTTMASKEERYRFIVNQAKWKAARAFAAQQGVAFRILTK